MNSKSNMWLGQFEKLMHLNHLGLAQTQAAGL